jgi:hypothetical protein
VTTGEMLAWTIRFNNIMACKHLRDMRLSNMMEDLRKAYNIPLLNNREFNKQNPHVIQLYRTVSYAREF